MKYGILALFCIISFAAKAQVKTTTLKGYIAVAGGESFTYKLVFSDSLGAINGYSLTYAEEKKEVRSSITGTIDRKARTFSFRETSIVYNHGFESKAIMCLVDTKLKYARSNNSYVLSGPFSSNDATNTSCGAGTISFVTEAELNELFADASAKSDTPKAVKKPNIERPASSYRPSRPVVNENYHAPTDKAPVADEITSGVDKIYEWHTDTVVAEIWDGGNVDGDIISVLYNNASILKRYTLAKEKKQLRIPLSGKDMDILTIVANNEGNEPPNTANILLIDGDKQYNIVAYNSIGQEANIKIKKVGIK